MLFFGILRPREHFSTKKNIGKKNPLQSIFVVIGSSILQTYSYLIYFLKWRFLLSVNNWN